ncbi:hypothetical protein BKA56DRAFT_596384, partial [Ilyonectria sp. MPI-CAGE-AT-0026]
MLRITSSPNHQANTDSSGLPHLPSRERRKWTECNSGVEEPSLGLARFRAPIAEQGRTE